jgi:hypothetical protein
LHWDRFRYFKPLQGIHHFSLKGSADNSSPAADCSSRSDIIPLWDTSRASPTPDLTGFTMTLAIRDSVNQNHAG